MLIRRSLAVAASLGLLAIAGPAFAAGPPYTVKVGNNTSGTFSSTFSLYGSPPSVTAGVPLNCTRLNANSTTTAGTAINPIFTFGSVGLGGCKINSTALIINPTTTWTFTGTGNNATTANETIAGRVANVAFTAQAGAPCSFSVSGYANASFNESTQRLVINEVPTSSTVGNLTVITVSGCGGRVQVGNKVTLVATLTASTSAGAVKLS